jgi:signal transduction histidine kinase
VHSVRRRLTIVLAAGTALVVLGAGLVLDRALRAQVTGEFDAALLARARALVALTEEEAGRIELDYVPETMPEFEREEAPDLFQFRLDDGRTLLRSRRLEGDLPRLGPPGEPGARDATLPGGRAVRVVEIAFVPRRGVPGNEAGEAPPAEGDAARRGVLLAVARGRESLDPLLSRMRLAVLGVGALAALLAAVLVSGALAAGFRPIERVASQVRRIDAEGLGARVATDGVPAELVPVVLQVNALLARLDEAFERERRFTGHVAHELRTPIAELASLASVASRWPGDEASTARFFDDVGQVARGMERVVAHLLLLARCQAGAETARTEPTRLRDALASAWASLPSAARAAVPAPRLDVPDDLFLETDADKLAIVLGNVLGNALAHGRPGAEVRVTASRVGARFRLDVENAAAPLDAGDLDRVAEPFWRKDAARSPGEHAGLGLALVSALTALLGIEVRFEQDADGTFRVRLEGPALPGDRRPATSPPALAVGPAGPRETIRESP